MNNTFCWMQLQTSNLPAAKDFYRALFSWSLEETSNSEHTYTQINAGEGPSGGMMGAPESVPSHWTPFVQVKDIKEFTEKAKTLGATIMVDPTDIAEGGRFSVLMDPAGATLGLYEPPASQI